MARAAEDRDVIVASNLSRTFRRADRQTVTAVDDVSFQIGRGQFVCLVGPSGCGKSTLLKLIAGLMLPSAGILEVEGESVTRPGPERGMVFQQDSVFPWLRVIDNVEYGLKCRGIGRAERRRSAEFYLERVGLSHVAKAWPRELSGGMLKRVAVATVFANGANVLLLDEPFGAVDYVTKRNLHDVLLALWSEAGSSERRTVVFVTHDVDEALILADRILVMHSGRFVDDLAVVAPRPRTTDGLMEPTMVQHKHVLLAHLGLETVKGATDAPPGRRQVQADP